MREPVMLRVNFKSRKLTAKEYLEFSKKILLALRTVHPIFENLCGWGTEAHHWHCFKNDLSDFDEIVLNQIDDDELAFINEDKSDKNLNYNSYSHIGYSNSYSNTKKIKDGKVTVTISDGKGKGIGFINIKFPQVGYDEFNSYKFVKKLIDTLIKLINPDYIGVIPKTLDRKVEQVDDEFSIGWITYFSNDEVCKFLPNSNKIVIHQIPKGCLFSIKIDNLNAITDKEIAIAEEIKEALEASNVLKNYYIDS